MATEHHSEIIFESTGIEHVSRGEFRLRWQQALETGGVVVGDEIKIVADISAVCTRPEPEVAAA